jgi:hypothetical protein
MAISVHPGVADACVFAYNTDIHFIGPQGPGECVHRAPKEIVAIQ